jgi:hypothetical protein
MSISKSNFSSPQPRAFNNLEKYQGYHHITRDQIYQSIFQNVTEKTRHGGAGFFGYGPDHKIGSIADVAAGSEKDRSG